jgi:hypothetical protein
MAEAIRCKENHVNMSSPKRDGSFEVPPPKIECEMSELSGVSCGYWGRGSVPGLE